MRVNFISRPLAGVAAAMVMLIALSACGEADGGSNTSRSEIDTQEAKWQQSNVNNYSIRYKLRCLCITRERELLVSDGRIERVDYKSLDSATDAKSHYDDRSYRSRYDNDDDVFTVEELFREVRAAHRDAYSVRVTYDETYGYPKNLKVDWYHNGIDDEEQILVTEFRVR